MKLISIATLPLLALAACSVENDPGNDQVTMSYDENVAENVADDLGNTAEGVAGEVGAAAESAGAAIENEVGDVDVDVDVDRDTNEAATTNSN